MNKDLLKRTRKYKGMDQKDIANKIGISHKAYNFKENGKSQFNREEILQLIICLELGFTEVNEIFFDNNITKR